MPTLPKKERLKIFLERLGASQPVRSDDDALSLLSKILDAVEDEFAGVTLAQDPAGLARMGPPREDNRHEVPHRPSLRRYRSRHHNTFIGTNGSIRIKDLDGKVWLDKPGKDGRKTHDLDTP